MSIALAGIVGLMVAGADPGTSGSLTLHRLWGRVGRISLRIHHQEKERITRFAYVGGDISDYLDPHPVTVLLYRALS